MKISPNSFLNIPLNTIFTRLYNINRRSLDRWNGLGRGTNLGAQLKAFVSLKYAPEGQQLFARAFFS